MFLDAGDQQAVEALTRGVFALPRLGDRVETLALADGPPLADDDRLRRSIRGMQANLRQHGFAGIAEELGDPDDGGVPARMEELVERILQAMRAYLEAWPLRMPLDGVFHRIQLWGGNTGRFIYVKGGGFAANFDLRAYEALAQAAASRQAAVEKIPRIQKAAGDIGFLGISFASKHASFWSQAAGTPCLPIYDRLVAQGCFGNLAADWGFYARYVDEMSRHAEEAGLGVATLERRAFNFFTSAAGERWIQARLSRN